jgi:hypothetical protein
VLPAASSDRRLEGPALRVVLGLLLVCFVAGCFGGDSQKTAALGPPHELEFVDVASDVGLDFRQAAFRWGVSGDPAAMEGGGLCWLDFDDDGWLDLYVVNSYAEQEVAQWKAAGGLPRSALFHNDHGRFEDVSAGSGADVEIRGNGCVAADLDLDGDTDLYVTTARSQVLLWNEGAPERPSAT